MYSYEQRIKAVELYIKYDRKELKQLLSINFLIERHLAVPLDSG